MSGPKSENAKRVGTSYLYPLDHPGQVHNQMDHVLKRVKEILPSLPKDRRIAIEVRTEDR